VLGELIAVLVDQLASDDPPGEGYLAKVGRLTAARTQAEQIILRDRIRRAPGDVDGQDGQGSPASGSRP